jgi:hypothetical protein
VNMEDRTVEEDIPSRGRLLRGNYGRQHAQNQANLFILLESGVGRRFQHAPGWELWMYSESPGGSAIRIRMAYVVYALSVLLAKITHIVYDEKLSDRWISAILYSNVRIGLSNLFLRHEDTQRVKRLIWRSFVFLRLAFHAGSAESIHHMAAARPTFSRPETRFLPRMVFRKNATM